MTLLHRMAQNRLFLLTPFSSLVDVVAHHYRTFPFQPMRSLLIDSNFHEFFIS